MTTPPAPAPVAATTVSAAAGEPLVVVEVAHHLLGQRVQPGAELAWLVRPLGTDDIESRWGATAFAVDLHFDDGTVLSRSGAVDQYGTPVTPSAQAAARQLWVDQWNLRRVDLETHTGRRITKVVALLGACSPDGSAPVVDAAMPARAVVVGAVSLTQRKPQPFGAVELVDTRRGTNSTHGFSRGNTAPLVALPNAGVFGLPMTDASSDRWPYTYERDHPVTGSQPSLEAFATSHIASPWMGDHGVFQVMPSPSTSPATGRAERALAFDRAAEAAHPHRYAVTFGCGVAAELTSTQHALSLRLDYLAGSGSVVVDHLGTVEELRVGHDAAVVTLDVRLRDANQPFPYFVHVRIPYAVSPHVALADGRLSGHVVVAPGAAPCDVVVAVSTVGPEQARLNATAAADHDATLAASREAWGHVQDLVQLEGASQDQEAAVRSALYRAFLYPTRLGESGPDGVSRHASLAPPPLRSAEGVVREGDASATHGFWDTYRTAWPLLALVDPPRAGTLAQGFVAHADDYGWTPRWSAPGPADCMTGTSLDIVLGDLATKDVPGFDVAAAYATALRNASVPAPDDRVGRKGLRPGIFRGHTDTATHEGLAWTLDNAINDWGAARLAATLLGRDRSATSDPEALEALEAEALWFAHRALTYRSVFDTARGFFVGRDPDGAWRAAPPFDPDVWGHDYTETNAWGTAFTAPHDGAGLCALHGGEARLGAALDAAFARPERAQPETSGWYGAVIHEQAEARDMRMGMVALSNQPAHHIPFMYHFAGRHDDAHRVVRDALARLFVGADLGQGYPGDEDNGEMGAWYLFATIGLYPLVPASGTYVLTPPAVARTEIRLPHGRPLVIETDHPERGFIAAVTVDGTPWHDISVPHEVIAAGAHLRFELSDTPQGWAADSRPVSCSELSGISELLTDATTSARITPPQAAVLVDDTGADAYAVGPGSVVEVHLPGTPDLVLYTLTSQLSGPLSWTVTYVDADGAVIAVEDRDEHFRWDRQTRAFRVSRGMPQRAACVRLTFHSAGALEQLELLAATAPSPNPAPRLQGS